MLNKTRIEMEKRPLYVTVVICIFCFSYSIFTYGSDEPLGWGYLFIGWLIAHNYLMKKK